MAYTETRESLNYLHNKLEELKLMLHYKQNKDKLTRVQTEMKSPNIWDKPNRAKSLGKQEARLIKATEIIDKFAEHIKDADEIFELLQDTQAGEYQQGQENNTQVNKDQILFDNLSMELIQLKSEVNKIEYEAMFGDENDENNAFMEIQAGQGGTEAQDWAEMLLRMYIKWADNHKIRSEILEISSGEVAGIKGASIRFIGFRAYGWLSTETGIHRLVRKSPFNSGNRRHTSFASVFVTPELDADISVEINPKDLRIDTYRASGAGGQHINKTDSAVRITHMPSRVVVQCQNQRSQHQNKESALRQLKSKLYLIEEEKRNAVKRTLEENKAEISWGRQIRSYVLDDSRIKDLRTGIEKSDCPRVLDGDLDDFIIASLQQKARLSVSI